jgi:diguanylate cyclase (GGDEF)-like protein
MMSIRYKFFFAFSALVALACCLALFGFRGIAASDQLVVRLYDGPLMGINHARAAHAALNDARLLIRPGLGDGVEPETVVRFEKLVADIAEDLKIVRERVQDRDVLAALTKAEDRVRDWSDTGRQLLEPPRDGLTMVPVAFAVTQRSHDAAAALDDLVETVAAYGFGYRMEAEATVAGARTTLLALAAATTLVGILLAIGFAWSMSKPISDAMQVAERVAAGNFTDQIASRRGDELGRLLRSLAAMQSRLKARADEDATLIRLDAALNNMSQGLCMFGPDNRLVLWNERYVKLYRIAPDQLFVGCSLEQMLEFRTAAGTSYHNLDEYHAMLQAAMKVRAPTGAVAELVDGRFVNVTYRPTQNGGWVSTHEDITERRASEARIAHLAFHDQLTDLPNRAAFNDHIAKTFLAASDGNAEFAVLSIDLDRFKEINDVYGHSAGDRFLVEIGRRLASACDGAFVARLGGDEFTIVSSGGPQPVTAEELCRRLSPVMDAPVRIDAHEIAASFTIGASVYPQDGADADTLVANAEAALYRAKAEARGTIRFFEPAMDRQIREKRSLQQDIAVALEKNELELYFQPQAMAGGEVFGFEVLLRWKHPVRGMVSPGLFIPLAEETRAIGPIDEWVLREACREAASWPNPLSIAVNLSPVDFRCGDVPGMILSVLLETGLHPQRLEIEITEGVLFEDFDRAISILRKIKNLGIRIAMDDFGTGYSSLSYLQSFPFDKIKIDRTFIAKIGNSFQAAAIIHAILGLGRALALPVIAEGVETEQQLAFLAQEGCEIQGYLIGHPQPIAHYQHLVTGFTARSKNAVSAA